jgi:hypothetical protein
MLAICARNRSLIGTPFSANWDTWGFDDPHKTQPRPSGAFFEGSGRLLRSALCLIYALE